jgi:WXG100 family type VII secretion target
MAVHPKVAHHPTISSSSADGGIIDAILRGGCMGFVPVGTPLRRPASSSRTWRCPVAKAIVDPEELRRFAHDLKRFSNELQNQMNVLHGRLMSLGQTWRDQEHTKFTEEFEQTMRALNKFNDAASQHIPFLLRKAERVDEYLQQR